MYLSDAFKARMTFLLDSGEFGEQDKYMYLPKVRVMLDGDFESATNRPHKEIY